MALVKVQVDISAIRNEVAQLHQELHSTYNVDDGKRRDIVNRCVEKCRHLKTLLEDFTQIEVNMK